MEATSAGDMRYNDRLPNSLSVSYRQQVLELYTRYKQHLMQINREDLNEEAKLNYDVLMWECEMAIEADKFKTHLLPVNQFWSLHLVIGQYAGGTGAQPFKTVKDYENWLSRLNGYVAWCDTAIANMKLGMKEQMVLPKALTLKVIPQFEALDHGRAEDHLFYSPITNFPSDFSDSDRNRLAGLYKTYIESKLIPAHKRMSVFLKQEYLPACRESSGISDVPDGNAYYGYLIKLFTTTHLGAEEIFNLGKAEVARIEKEMEIVKNQVGFKGDMNAFFEHLRTKKELMPFSKPEQVIQNFQAIYERMKPNLSRLFVSTPKTPFEIRRTESFRESSASAEYVQGSLDGTRPGIFYVPVPDVTHYNVLSDEDLFLHEAIPGHHYQISLQQEDTTLPDFRKLLFYSAYGEGWALYSESLGKELGLYSDPYQYLGMLSAEMHRSIRLVVDVGMHTQGWTREMAIAYSKEHEAETEASIIAEIERYMAIPGQALSYKIGQIKIKELRAKAEKALGSKFRLSEFHREVLESGTIPLKLLEDKIDRWIEVSLKL